MRPSRVLRVYLGASLAIGVLASVPLIALVQAHELAMTDSGILTLSLNVLLLLILPLVLDWSERKYFKARFLALEELGDTNPELKKALESKCEQLALPGLRLATVDTPSSDMFIYGLWRNNPRLVLPAQWLEQRPDGADVLPSIEVELTRFAKRDVSMVYLGFVAAELAAQWVVLHTLLH